LIPAQQSLAIDPQQFAQGLRIAAVGLDQRPAQRLDQQQLLTAFIARQPSHQTVPRTEARFAGFRPRRPAGRNFRAAMIDGRDCSTRGSKTGKGAWGVLVSSDRTA
jgi:hypothetical protein